MTWRVITKNKLCKDLEVLDKVRPYRVIEVFPKCHYLESEI